MKRSALFAMAVFFLLVFNQQIFSQIRVISTTGTVAYKSGTQWVPLRSGTTLSEGTKISTGVRSSAVIMIGDHKVTVKPLTMIKLYSHSANREEENTRIGLKYGKINAKISKVKKLKTVFRVSTPVATSSVRGTEEDVSYGPKSGMTMFCLTGSAQSNSRTGYTKYVWGRSRFQQNPSQGKPKTLMSHVRGNSLHRLHSLYVTDTESDLHQYYGDELFDNSDGPDKYTDLTGRRKANATFKIVWP